MMKTLALIPARGGSKRVPGKNIKDFGGKPLIAHTIEAALGARYVDRIIVSTDDEAIANAARAAGANVPFLRPSELALDSTPDRPVLLHALDWLKDQGQEYGLVALLRPTTPFKSPELIDQCVGMLNSHAEYSSIRTVCRAEGGFHPYWMFQNHDGVLAPFIEGISLQDYYQSQLLPECLRLNGVVDVLRTSVIRSGNDHYGPKVGFVPIEDTLAVDIDTPLDFEYAEFLLQRRKR